MTAQIEVIIILCVTITACAVPGTFLMLKGRSFTLDTLSHSVTAGILAAAFLSVKAYALTLLAAALGGGAVAALSLYLERKGVLKRDSAAAFFVFAVLSCAVILLSVFETRIDADALFFGELAFAPLERYYVLGLDLGPKALYRIGFCALLNIAFAALFYKEIRLAVFDESFAEVLNLRPRVFIYCVGALSAVTAAAAAGAVGVVLVAGLFIGPSMIALLFTHRLWVALILSCVVGIVVSVVGYDMAHRLDMSIAGGALAVMGGAYVFAKLAASLFSAIKRGKEREELGVKALKWYLLKENRAVSALSPLEIAEIFDWKEQHAARVLKRALEEP